MSKIVQIQVVAEIRSDGEPIVDIFALSDDGRLLIRPVAMKDYKPGEWAELTFPPKKIPTQAVK